MGWKDKPTAINNLEIDGGYIFAIDENGTSILPESIPFMDESEKDPNKQWLTLTGIMINLEEYNLIQKNVIDLKNKYWRNGLFKDKRVVFHSRDIRKKQGAFNPKIIDYDSFMFDLRKLLSDSKYKIFSINVDKYRHVNQYVTPHPVYELSAEFILERFCFELQSRLKKGIILFESRGEHEDKELLEKVLSVISEGNDFSRPKHFNRIEGVYFNPKRTEDEKLSYWVLELADIVSYKIHRYIKNDERDELFNSIEKKIYKYPNHYGKGLKIFPRKEMNDIE